MKRRKGNVLMKKLNLLNSQDYSDDISWSSSDNSDSENKSSNISFGPVSNSHRKRKRKKKNHTNLSSLNVSIINPSDNKNESFNDKSPIIYTKYCKQAAQSPILKPQLLATHKYVNIPHSPILNSKMQIDRSKERSPILVPKHQTTALSPNVRKKLFNVIDKTAQKVYKIHGNLESSVQYIKSDIVKVSEAQIETASNRIKVLNESSLKTSGVTGKNITKLDLMKRVQSYFDSQFSSESASQHSISECETVTQDTPKSSEELEISNSISQNKFLQTSHEQDDSFINNTTNTKKRKKIKYKKDGLAYRLNNLLIKQNCNISLWQHEKFLARSSNFVIPKSEYRALRIKNVIYKYNCYLVDSIDVNGGDYLLLINACYVINCIISPNYILKLYEPYKIVDLNNDRKVIVNVCKFECVPLKM